jgi:hypothetical protein
LFDVTGNPVPLSLDRTRITACWTIALDGSRTSPRKMPPELCARPATDTSALNIKHRPAPGGYLLQQSDITIPN